jgi:CheY-like chemotaxis protein
MARVLAVVPDLMFGSRLHAALGAVGHEVTLVADAQGAADAAPAAQILVADLASGELDPAALLAALGAPRPPALACFAHVEPAAREAALAAGFDLVVPRSRLNREAPELVARLLAAPR